MRRLQDFCILRENYVNTYIKYRLLRCMTKNNSKSLRNDEIVVSDVL